MLPIETWKIVWPVLRKKYKREGTFLNFKNPFELLVAVIMSAQCTDDAINKITPALFKKYPKPADLAKAPIGDVEKIIKSSGFYHAKARNIKKTAQMICGNFKGKVPDDEAQLQTLPGVGRKTAVAVLNNAFNKNVGIAVDTHVIRFAKRFNLSNKTDPSKIEADLLKLIPQKYWKEASYAIKEYGRYEGKARPYDPKIDPLQTALQIAKGK